MTQPARPSARGRRNPDLLSQAQTDEQGTPEPDNSPVDEIDTEMQLLFEGDYVKARVSIPVTLTGTERYSIVESEALAHCQPGETGLDTAQRARLAMRVSFLESIDEMEEDLARYAEQRAADAAAMQRHLS